MGHPAPPPAHSRLHCPTPTAPQEHLHPAHQPWTRVEGSPHKLLSRLSTLPTGQFCPMPLTSRTWGIPRKETRGGRHPLPQKSWSGPHFWPLLCPSCPCDLPRGLPRGSRRQGLWGIQYSTAHRGLPGKAALDLQVEQGLQRKVLQPWGTPSAGPLLSIPSPLPERSKSHKGEADPCQLLEEDESLSTTHTPGHGGCSGVDT